MAQLEIQCVLVSADRAAAFMSHCPRPQFPSAPGEINEDLQILKANSSLAALALPAFPSDLTVRPSTLLAQVRGLCPNGHPAIPCHPGKLHWENICNKKHNVAPIRRHAVVPGANIKKDVSCDYD